jgi:hypothetical protein
VFQSCLVFVFVFCLLVEIQGRRGKKGTMVSVESKVFLSLSLVDTEMRKGGGCVCAYVYVCVQRWLEFEWQAGK